MSDQPKVSVIVPMYNPGNVIQRGLRSLRAQYLKDIEILLVDDGSREETLSEAKKAAEEDERIRILHTEENGGAGIARNLGIEHACGEYLAFVDADDFIAPDFLSLLYKKAKLYQADIAKGTLIHVSQNGERKKAQPAKGENPEIRGGLKKAKPLYTLFRSNHYSAIYRRAWIMDGKIRYGTSRYGEDSTFLLKVTADTKRIVFDDRACYYLVDHPDSLMNRMPEERLDAQLLSLREQVDFLIGHFGENIDPEYEIQRIQWTLGLQAAAVRLGGMEQKADAFLDGIRAEVLRLPNLPRLVLYSPMTGALTEYRANLSSVIMRKIERKHEEDAMIECIVRCFRFASFHPGRTDLYDMPIKDSLERGFGYVFGMDPFHEKGLPLKEKAAFTLKLTDELRKNVDPHFWERKLKEWLTPKKLLSAGGKVIKRVMKP